MARAAVNKTTTKSTSSRKFTIPKLTDLKKMPIGDILRLSQEIIACQKAIQSLVGGINIPGVPQYPTYQQPVQPSLIPTSSKVELPIRKSEGMELKVDQSFSMIDVNYDGKDNWLDDEDALLPFSQLEGFTEQLTPSAEISELVPEE